MTSQQRARITTLEICPLPASVFADLIDGSAGVVWAGLARRAALHARRLESIALAADALGRPSVALKARAIQDAAIGSEDTTRFLNSPFLGMWLQAAVVCLDRETDPSVVSKVSGSSAVEAVDSSLCDLAEACMSEFPVNDVPALDSGSPLAKAWVPGLRDPDVWLLRTSHLSDLIRHAWIRVDDALPELANLGQSVVSRVVGHKMKDGRLVSSTFSEMLGCVYISEHIDDALLGEQLVHETAHTMLFATQTLDDLVLESWPNESWEDARFYSPWRQDPRSLNGVLHGCYVFHEVARYWLAQPASVAARAGRLGLVAAQLEAGFDTLKQHGKWTPAGQAFFGALLRRAECTVAQARESVDGSVAEVIDIEDLSCAEPLSCEQHAVRHRLQWETRNAAQVGKSHD